MDGFLKKLHQEFHFGCLFSLKSILSTSEEYFSIFSFKSNFVCIIKYFFVSLKIELLYEKLTCSLFNVSIIQDSRSNTSVSTKFDSISNQKHQALPKTAHQTVQGSHINLCHKSCQYCVSRFFANSQIFSQEKTSKIFVSLS